MRTLVFFFAEAGLIAYGAKNQQRQENLVSKIVMSVHEFTTIMGHLDQKHDGNRSKSSIYDSWYDHWKAVEEKLEDLGLMERADMLFDGKITVNALSADQLEELLSEVQGQIMFHETLIKDNDEDADPEDLEAWKARLKELRGLGRSGNWESGGAI